MMDSLMPSEHAVQVLKDQVEEAKRQAQYEALKNELEEMQGVMPISNTDKVLKTKRTRLYLIEVMLIRI